jgi:drug/metabolite transporter (DMT)-like permease
MPTSSQLPHHGRALLMLVLATLFWGLSFPVIKAIVAVHGRLLPDGGTWFVTASVLAPRFLLSALVLGVFCWRSLATLTRSEWRQGAGLGLFAAIGMVFQSDGLQFTSASTSAFLTQLYAILIPVWLAWRARRSPPWTVWVSSVLVLAGVAVLARLDGSDLRLGRGEFETLLASVFFMGQILWLDRPEFAGNRALPVTAIMLAIVGLVSLALAGMTMPRATDLIVPWTSGAWVGLTLVLTFFSTLGAYAIMNAWQPKITATEAGLIYCVEPVFASLLALVLPAWFSIRYAIDYPNEIASANLLLGGGLITAANVLIQLKPPPKQVAGG